MIQYDVQLIEGCWCVVDCNVCVFHMDDIGVYGVFATYARAIDRMRTLERRQRRQLMVAA